MEEKGNPTHSLQQEAGRNSSQLIKWEGNPHSWELSIKCYFVGLMNQNSAKNYYQYELLDVRQCVNLDKLNKVSMCFVYDFKV